MRLIIFIIIVAHSCGCFFHYIAIVQPKSSDTWLETFNLKHKPLFDRYINALYFAFITMITIGFGDITPISNVEKIYVILMSFIASGLFAYAVNTIGSIFSDIEEKNASYK